MTRPDCPLCTSPARNVEGPLHDGSWFCTTCGRVFPVPPAPHVGEAPRLSNFRSAINGRAVKGEA